MTRHLVLLGSGHANLHVLEAIPKRCLSDVKVTLVSPAPRQVYSGMLAGWLTGSYALDDCTIDVERLARVAGGSFVCSTAMAIDPTSRVVSLSNGEKLAYDVLSINVGSSVRHESLDQPGITSVRPLQGFVDAYTQFLRNRSAGPVIVVGGGMGGVEIACALRAATDFRVEVTLIAGSRGVAPSWNSGLRRRIRHALKSQGVHVLEEDAQHFDSPWVETSNGRRLFANFVVLATGPGPAPMLQQSNLSLDDDGYLMVDATLRSTADASVFAAGDCASLPNGGDFRSGVFAVRQGPVLAHNLHATLTGAPLKNFEPQRRVLYLVATGAHQAIASWGQLSGGGRWCWSWKRHIDQTFVHRFNSATSL